MAAGLPSGMVGITSVGMRHSLMSGSTRITQSWLSINVFGVPDAG